MTGCIYCGFAGIGKSTAAKAIPGVVDLESTPFLKNWLTYANVAAHMAANGYTVLMSCHREIGLFLLSRSVPFVTLLPEPSLKEEYLERYEARGSAQSFIDMMERNWNDFVLPIGREPIIRLSESEYVIYLLKRRQGSR